MSEKIFWGLDIGGTKCAICAAGEDGKIFYREQVATADYPRWQELLETLLEMGAKNAPHPTAVGVSCGGPLDTRRGLILSPPNLPGWDDVPVTKWLTEKLGIPAYLQNDANACALAEWEYGAGKGTRNMIFITFGTGFGAGLILDGRLYEGTNGMAGEIGHVRMEYEGPVGYGKKGTMEGFCSGGGLKQLAKIMIGKDLTAKELAHLADQGDEEALSVFSRSARILGRGLSILIDLFNPERIVIGSVFARAERHFRKEMEEEIEKEALSINRGSCRVVPAALGDSIGDLAAISTAIIGWRNAQ
ncbi:MAG: ROK family protein [Clostridia bacterium]|nr:ROK family protein [Clostridiales bacterium]MBQ6805171.1 ROK family protein [Clostridia bacterium]